MAALVKSRGERRAARRAGEGGKRVEYLSFGLAGETYAVAIELVAEILRPLPITEVPRAPETVLGVISVRGKLVTVIDLRRRFNLPAATLDRRSRILLADTKNEQIGVLVDDVQQVWRLASEEIEPANVLGGEQAAHISGIGRPAESEGTVLILLELKTVLEAS
jgi:purine-binding chemotaxis protein CheW